jgi:hypothetical protein
MTRPAVAILPQDAAPVLQAKPEPSLAGARVGTCTATQHPTLSGRVRVRCEQEEGVTEEWLPCLHGLAIRELDRVLVQQPLNWPEPVVVGVVDGFALRPEAPLLPGPAIVLQPDEAVRIQAPDGTPLIELFEGDAGPVVRLLDDGLDLEIKGKLRMRAKSIELAAEQGGINLSAKDDVIVVGEVIRLN